MVGVSPGSSEWFASYLCNREKCVKVNGVSTRYFPKSGKPERPVLAPTPFILYINGQPISLACSTSIFADDTPVSTPGNDPKTTGTRIAEEMAHVSEMHFGLQFNAKKSAQFIIETIGRSKTTA